MKPETFRTHIQLIESIQSSEPQQHSYQWIPILTDDQGQMIESDQTDQIDFDPDDSMEQVIDKVTANETNRIGIGKYRQGWHHPFDKRLIIKQAVCRDDTNVAKECTVRNLWEFMVWWKCKSENLPELEHLMPCYECHPLGHWLTQFKGRRINNNEHKRIKGSMQWVGDRSKGNYAMLGDEVKSIDYATTKAMEHLDLPQDYDSCVAAVKQILDQLDHDYTNPSYGKSTVRSNPYDDKD